MLYSTSLFFRLKETERLRHLDLLFLSVIWRADHHRRANNYEAVCKHLRPHPSTWIDRIEDVGSWGRWHRLETVSKDPQFSATLPMYPFILFSTIVSLFRSSHALFSYLTSPQSHPFIHCFQVMADYDINEEVIANLSDDQLTLWQKTRKTLKTTLRTQYS